jgi:hypothetical protein
MVMPPGAKASVTLTSLKSASETKLIGDPVGTVEGSTVYRTEDGVVFVVSRGTAFPALGRSLESPGEPLVHSWRAMFRSQIKSAIAETASDPVEDQVGDCDFLAGLPLAEAADALRRMLVSPSAPVREAAKVGLTKWSKINQLTNQTRANPPAK